MYSLDVASILSKAFFSDLERGLRNSFHSCSSRICASRNDGRVLPISHHPASRRALHGMAKLLERYAVDAEMYNLPSFSLITILLSNPETIFS